MRSSPRRSKRCASAAFTLVELVMTTALLGVVMGTALLVSNRSIGSYESARKTSSIEAQAQRALRRARLELLDSSVSVLLPATLEDEFGASDITFQRALDYQAGAIVWGPVERLAFEYDPAEANDGVDNDGDGLIDEGQLVLTRDDGGPTEQRLVLCRQVREYQVGETGNNLDDNGNGIKDERGFHVHRQGGVLTLRLCLEEDSARVGLTTRSISSAVRMRN